MVNNDRIEEIKDKLENEDLSSHKRDELKRELNKLQNQKSNGANTDLYRTVGIAVLALAIITGGGYALASAGVIDLSVNNGGGETVDASQISLDGEPVLGNENASVTVVGYEDFQCPACAAYEQRVAPQIKQDYVESGDVKMVYKDFPLSQMHEWAATASTTMECVYRQDNDAFWNVKTKVFNNQNSISQSNARSKILNWAEEEGVNKDDVQACIQNENPQDEVQGDLQEGRNLGVTGTPTIFINGKKVVGGSYSQYKNIIEQELAK